MSFSKRHGIKQEIKTLQTQSIDQDLRNSLWNALTEFYWGRLNASNFLNRSPRLGAICQQIWKDYFKAPIDNLPNYWPDALKTLRNYFFKCEWNEVYDFIEFMVNVDGLWNDEFIARCNFYLERECAGYRFIDKKITPITDPVELGEIGEAASLSDEWKQTRQHIRMALEKMSDRKNPDYRNSIKESISAVEAACGKIVGKPGATLGDALKSLEKKGKVEMHAAFRQAFDKLYGYTSDADGIRHALLEESSLGFEDSKFMLVVCSAFINFAIAKMK